MADPAATVGIDLGTTNSCVAWVRNGRPHVIELDGHRTIPSMVCVDPDGKVSFGLRARQRLTTHPQNAAYGFKRLLGRRFTQAELEEIRKHFFYTINLNEASEAVVSIEDRTFAVEKLSALVLLHIRKLISEQHQFDADAAVISVPAYFNQPQRDAVRRAARSAGFEVLRILNEPTAAALAYGLGKGERQTLMVYDLGGGTFDVTILEVRDRIFSVLGTGGDAFLGGLDFDQRLVEYLKRLFFSETGVDLSNDPVALSRLRDAAEQLRIDLSSVERGQLEVPFLAIKDGEKLSFSHTLTRKEFERLAHPLVEETLKHADTTLHQAGLTSDEVDALIFVGGMTRTPLIREAVRKHYHVDPRKDVHPDEIVALGAAVLADALAREERAVELRDVLPVSIGVDDGQGNFVRVLNKNTTVPIEAIYRADVAGCGPGDVLLTVYQGEHERCTDNDCLGELRLPDSIDAGKLPPKLEVHFALDADSVLLLSAKVPGTGEQLHCTFASKPLDRREQYAASGFAAASEPETSGEASEHKSTGLLGRLWRRRQGV